jgi:hypothetical protein
LLWGNQIDRFYLSWVVRQGNKPPFVNQVCYGFAAQAVALLQNVNISAENDPALAAEVLSLSCGCLYLASRIVDLDVAAGCHDAGFGVGFLNVRSHTESAGRPGLRVSGRGDRACQSEGQQQR